MLEIPDIFLGWTIDAGSEPTYAEKIRVPPPPPPPGVMSWLSSTSTTPLRRECNQEVPQFHCWWECLFRLHNFALKVMSWLSSTAPLRRECLAKLCFRDHAVDGSVLTKFCYFGSGGNVIAKFHFRNSWSEGKILTKFGNSAVKGNFFLKFCNSTQGVMSWQSPASATPLKRAHWTNYLSNRPQLWNPSFLTHTTHIGHRQFKPKYE